MTRAAVLALGLLVACATAACVPASSELDGTSWRGVAIAGQSVIPGREPTLAFADGKVTGSGGCNGFGAAYRLEGDRITFTDLAMTAMGCLGPEGALEERFIAILGTAERVVASGDRLSLVSPGGSLDYVRVPG